ncbi:MAG: hypothetical protein AB7I19_16965 [Planctomycetota bacterium]
MSTFHRIERSLLLSLALGSAALAQGLATTEVVPGCQGAAPTGSLSTAISDTRLFRQDAQGVFAIEAESGNFPSPWVLETVNSGFSGAGYLRWSGPNYFSSPGQGTFSVRLFCELPQRYRLSMHNRHDHADPSEENDCWMSINGASWLKIYSNNGSNARAWNWHTRVDPGHGMYEFNLNSGINELRISGRSSHFKLDRIHIYPVPLNQVHDLNVPQSARQGERPVVGTTVNVRLGDPANQAGMPAGSTNGIVLLSTVPSTNTPCGVSFPGAGKTGGDGEFLLGLSPAPSAISVGLWQGPSQPINLALAIPNQTALNGLEVYLQGVFATTAGRLVLSERLDLTIGTR